MTDVSNHIFTGGSTKTSPHRIWWQNAPVVVLLLATFAGATTGYGASLQGKTVLLPVGTTFEGRVDTNISSTSSRQGDKFMIGMATPVLINGSEVAIPAGSQIVGEVVEAIPAGHLPHKKHYPKPYGKLRIQLSGLRLPDGAAYPLVASLAPESYESQNGRERKAVSNLGRSVGYVGSESAFDNAGSGASRTSSRGSAPRIMGQRDFMRDPMLGHEDQGSMNGSGRIRSMQLKGHDLFIQSGSPVTIKLDAPLKLTMSASMAPALAPTVNERSVRNHGRRFGREEQAPQEVQNGPFAPGSLPFLRSPQQVPPQGGPGMQQGGNRMPPPGQQPPPPAQSGGSSDF
jgi:hypothetical protein